VFNGDTAYITQLKQKKIKKVLLLLQHLALMSTCSYVARFTTKLNGVIELEVDWE